MPSARYWPICLAALLFAPLGVIAPKGEVPLLLILAVAALVVAILRRGGQYAGIGSERHWLWAVLGCGLAWALLSNLWTLDPLDGLVTGGRMAAILLAAYVLLSSARAPTARDARVLSNWLLAGFAIALALVIADLATGLAARAWYYHAIGRPGAFDPTLLNRSVAILLLMSWPAALVMYKRGWTKLAVLAPLFAAGAAMAGVSSSNKLAAVAGLLVAICLWRFRAPTHRAILLLLLGALMVAPLLPPTVLSPSLLEDSFDDYDSGLHRLYIWEFAASRIADRPVLGWGLSSSSLIPGGEAKLPHGGNRMNVHPHNAFLQIWLELGAVGAFISAAILLLIMRSLDPPAERIAAATTGGLLLSAVVVANLSFGIWQTWWMATLALVWILFAAVLRGSRDASSNQVT